jgi:hypothetical protein
VKDQASCANSSQRRQQRRDAAEAIVEGGVAWQTFERFRRLAVEDDHACNVLGIANVRCWTETMNVWKFGSRRVDSLGVARIIRRCRRVQKSSFI